MKKMTWGKLTVLVLSVSLVLASCKKGSDGAPGAPGTANVIYSAWTDVAASVNSSQTAYVGTITAAKLVDSILQKGDVRVYVNLGTAAAPNISPLPYLETYFTTDTTTITYSMYPTFTSGKITITGNFDCFVAAAGVHTLRKRQSSEELAEIPVALR